MLSVKEPAGKRRGQAAPAWAASSLRPEKVLRIRDATVQLGGHSNRREQQLGTRERIEDGFRLRRRQRPRDQDRELVSGPRFHEQVPCFAIGLDPLIGDVAQFVALCSYGVLTSAVPVQNQARRNS